MLKINRLVNIEAFFSAFEAVFDPDYRFSGERHNFWELVYAKEGCIGVAEDEKIYRLKAGEAIFHMPMEFHRIWSEQGTSPRVIFMTFSAPVGDLGILGKGVFKLNPILDSILREALDAAAYCREMDDPIKNQLSALNLEKFILTLMESQTPESRQQKTKGTANYRAIIKVMTDNVEKNLCSEDIAHLCGLSLSNLKKTFRKYTGMGIMEYFNSLKIMRAMTLMAEGLSMTQISDRLGYSSPNYFSEAFKKNCGVTPTRYKKDYITEIGGILL